MRAVIKQKVINERFPNENLYKNDIRYQMNTDLNFESSIDQENASRDIRDRFDLFLKIAVPILYWNKLLFSFSSVLNSVLSLISIGTFIASIFILWLKKKKENSNSHIVDNNLLLRFMLELLQVIFIIFKCDHSDGITLQKIGIWTSHHFFINIGLDTPIKQYFSFYLLNYFLILSLSEHSDKNMMTRLISNLCSSKCVSIFLIGAITFLIQYNIRKGIREIWALYDSFKRSYLTVKKCLYDDFPYPVVIFNKKSNHQIYYKNSKTDNLIQRVKKLKNSSEGAGKKTVPVKTPTPNFSRRIPTKSTNSIRKEEYLDEIFFDKEIQIMFETELDKCINNKKKFFDFPLKISNEKNLNINFHRSSKNVTFFEGDMDNFEWYRIVVSSCFWKNQESVYIQMIKNDDFHGNDLINNYMSRINEELNKVISNANSVCDKIIDSELSENKREKINMASNAASLSVPKAKTSGKLVTSPTGQDAHSSQNTNFKTFAIKRQPTLLKNPNPVINYFPINSASLPQYDYSIWFLLKCNTLFVYDMFLSLQTYASIINKHLLSNNYKIVLSEFILYLEDYFKVACKLKNFKLVFINNSIEDELVVCYSYFRVTVFNILLFILNNSNELNKEDNILEINIKTEKEFTGEDYKIKFNFKYKDENFKINFNDVSKILGNHFKGVINCKQDQAKIQILDIGMVTVYYILNQVYENDLVMHSEGPQNSQHSISFFLKGKYQRNNGGDHVPSLSFIQPKSKISNQYYNKILSKMYNIHIPNCVSVTDSPNQNFNLDLKVLPHQRVPTPRPKDELIEEIESDNSNERLKPEEINTSIQKDRDLVNEINIRLSKHFENYDKLVNNKYTKIEENIPRIRQKGLSLTSLELNLFYSDRKVKFDDHCRSKVKYFHPPRFLIVEDNAFGRINLIDILKKQRFDYLIDISAYGWESIQKFKFFLNKGFIYDIIFMDINLLDMLGSEAAKIMRDYERQYTDHHTNIVAVSVEGKKNIKFEKPIKSEEFTEYISKHFSKNRPDIKI